jgi:peptide/nickel transport system substrate-binding protein
MLSRVNIRVAYRPLPFNVLLPKLTSGDTSLYVLGWTGATFEPEGALVPLAHSRNGPGLGEYNFGGYSNPKVDALIDQGRLQFDEAKRAALFSEATKVMEDDVAFVPLIHRHVTWAMRKNVKAVLRPNDNVDLRFVNIE